MASEDPSFEDGGFDLEKLRSIVQDSLSKHLYTTAIFFADKLVTFSNSNPDDVYTLAQCYYASKQYRRVLHVIRHERSVEDISESFRFRYLAAKCLFECKEYEDCQSVLAEAYEDPDGVGLVLQWRGLFAESSKEASSMAGALCLLHGKVYDALENRQRAAEWYKRALHAHAFCYEALEELFEKHMLTSDEEQEVLRALPVEPGSAWLGLVYACKAKKYDQSVDMEAIFDRLERGAPPGGGAREAGAEGGAGPVPMDGGDEEDDDASTPAHLRLHSHLPAGGFPPLGAAEEGGNADVGACKAEWYFQRGEYAVCYAATKKLLERDPYHFASLPVHLAAALELRKKNELFIKSHDLMKEYPDRAVAPFAVGCYYYCIRNFDLARRYFSRATQLSSNFAPAWLGFGHAFAAQDESDQAMAAYRTATRLFPGNHMAVLCIGMEYQRTNNFEAARTFFLQAQAICPTDPLVYNELGVLAFRNKQYAQAEQDLRHALRLIPAPMVDTWESTMMNLGNAVRKQRRYGEAIDLYEKALSLNPRGASTHSSIGFAYHLSGDLDHAIEYYHKAMGLKPDDGFTRDMLVTALSEAPAVLYPPLIDPASEAANQASDPMSDDCAHTTPQL